MLIPISAPSLTEVWGSSAEWIVERPTKPDGSYYTLPDYGTVEFDTAMAWTKSGSHALLRPGHDFDYSRCKRREFVGGTDGSTRPCHKYGRAVHIRKWLG